MKTGLKHSIFAILSLLLIAGLTFGTARAAEPTESEISKSEPTEAETFEAEVSEEGTFKEETFKAEISEEGTFKEEISETETLVADTEADTEMADTEAEPVSLEGASVTAPDMEYTGQALTPEPTVTLNDVTLVRDRDYTVTYSNNVDVGTAGISVTGTGNYTGTAQGSFRITECVHAWGEWTIEKDATCTETGMQKRVCTKCDAAEIQEIAAKGHTEVIDEAVEATCTEKGLTEGSHCSVCGEVLKAQEEVEALDHDWQLKEVKKEPTCTAEGESLYVCKRCDAEKTEAVPKVDHTFVKDEVIPATCTEGGKTGGEHCSVCGLVLTAQKDLPPLGHRWDDGVVEDGKIKYTCTECGETKEEALPATEYKITKGAGITVIRGINSAISLACNGDISKFVSVEVDGKVVGAENYDVVSGSTVVTFNKAFVDSLREGTHTYRVNYIDGYAETTFNVKVQDVDSVKTGDSTPIRPVAVVMLISFCVVVLSVLVLCYSKKREF